MQASQSSTAKQDNLFGICAALGEDFGFNPLYLRLALAVSLLWNPMAVVGGYAAAGVVVAFSRLLVPNPRPTPRLPQAPAAELPQERDIDMELARAA